MISNGRDGLLGITINIAGVKVRSKWNALSGNHAARPPVLAPTNAVSLGDRTAEVASTRNGEGAQATPPSDPVIWGSRIILPFGTNCRDHRWLTVGPLKRL